MKGVMVYESVGMFATGTTVIPVDGPRDQWTVRGMCGCKDCQTRAFDGVEPMRLVLQRKWDGLLGTCVPQDRVMPC